MMEALTLRGLQETDTIKPEDGKSENGNSETEDGNLKSHFRCNLSRDHDGGSDPERTSRDRHDQARERETSEWEIVNQRWKLEIPFSIESKQRSWWRLWPWEDFKRQTRSSQRTGNQRLEIVNQRRKLQIPFSTESKKRSWWRLWPWEDLKRQTRSSQMMGNQRTGNCKPKTEPRNPFFDWI